MQCTRAGPVVGWIRLGGARLDGWGRIYTGDGCCWVVNSGGRACVRAKLRERAWDDASLRWWL